MLQKVCTYVFLYSFLVISIPLRSDDFQVTPNILFFKSRVYVMMSVLSVLWNVKTNLDHVYSPFLKFLRIGIQYICRNHISRLWKDSRILHQLCYSLNVPHNAILYKRVN